MSFWVTGTASELASVSVNGLKEPTGCSCSLPSRASWKSLGLKSIFSKSPGGLELSCLFCYSMWSSSIILKLRVGAAMNRLSWSSFIPSPSSSSPSCTMNISSSSSFWYRNSNDFFTFFGFSIFWIISSKLNCFYNLPPSSAWSSG